MKTFSSLMLLSVMMSSLCNAASAEVCKWGWQKHRFTNLHHLSLPAKRSSWSIHEGLKCFHFLNCLCASTVRMTNSWGRSYWLLPNNVYSLSVKKSKLNLPGYSALSKSVSVLCKRLFAMAEHPLWHAFLVSLWKSRCLVTALVNLVGQKHIY